MDGVLLDTEPLYTKVFDLLLAPYGASLDPVTKLEIMGRTAIKSALHVIRKFSLPLTPEEFVLRREPLLLEIFSSSPAMKGAESFVRALKSQGMALAVATSTAKALFETKTQGHSWFELFDEIVCGDDAEVAQAKPAPDIFLVAARRLNMRPNTLAIFEDSPAGVQAARASGAYVYALIDAATDPTKYHEAHHIVHSFSASGFV